MSLLLAFHVDKPLPRAALLRAFDVDDDGAAVLEIGRAETGATCALVDEGDGRFSLHLPLVRTPTSARDLLPAAAAAAAAAGARLGPPDDPSPRSVEDLIAIWDAAHARAVRDLAALCAAQGLPPPPHLPRAELFSLHGWLVAAADDDDVPHPILALDPHDGAPALTALRLPRPAERATCKLPPLHAVLADLGPPRDVEEPLVWPLAALQTGGPAMQVVDVAAARALLATQEGEPLARYRVVTPVELVESELLT